MGIVDRLREMADLFEAQQAPHNLVLHLRTGADEIDRLRAGGCARDQGLTQHCAEAAKKDAEIASLINALADERTESLRLRAALERIVVCCENDFNGGKTLIRRDVIEARAALEGK